MESHLKKRFIVITLFIFSSLAFSQEIVSSTALTDGCKQAFAELILSSKAKKQVRDNLSLRCSRRGKKAKKYNIKVSCDVFYPAAYTCVSRITGNALEAIRCYAKGTAQCR